MIRMIQSQSSGHAKDYFSEALSKSDYYLGAQELNGTFRGELSKRLGITGIATKERFFALCENRHPESGEPLTPRTKKNRRVGYDINFHVPKSVSILHALVKDNHVLEAFHSSVLTTMKDIEADARARVRKGGKNAERITGELLYVDFIHQTARPVDGFAPDPHLHAHCFAFNVTWDETEQRLKACEFHQINKDMPFFQAMFHKRLADNLVALGYQIRQTEKSFEVEGVPQEVLELFSKRTDEIGRIAKEKGITDAKELSELGARTRAKKQKGLTMEELRADWRSQIHGLQPEIENIPDEPIRFGKMRERTLEQRNLSLDQCIDYTLLHCFERASVMPMRKIISTALRYSMGSALTAEDITKGFEGDSRIIRIQEKNQTFCTTKEVLAEEQAMVHLANAGRGKFAPLYSTTPPIQAKGQQGEAIAHVLSTPDMVSIVRGAAGAGKTTLMTEATKLIEQTGKSVTVLAPSADASRGTLRTAGFNQAETVALFLLDEKMQEKIKGQVLWVDEAGMLGTKDMKALLEITTKQNARLVLGGDTRQHASVVRGDALRILNTVGGIKTAEVNKIYRQKEELYRKAVADLSKGNIRDGFDKLDQNGAIKEAGGSNAYEELVTDYIKALKAGKEVLVISPTHEQGEKVTEALRVKLKETGFIGKKEIAAARYKNLNLTEAQKTDWRNYKEDQVIQFSQNSKGIKRGSAWRVDHATEKEVVIRSEQGEHLSLPLNQSDRFEVYKKSHIQLAKGDKVQITRNGFDRDNKRLNNGQVFEVHSVSKKGDIVISNAVSKLAYTINKDFGNISHAHCITSHSSQGKTVDEIFIAQSSATFPASNAKQFYVSVSRAREKVFIYTDDKEALMYRVSSSGDRQSAMELVKEKDIHLDHVYTMQRQNQLSPEQGQIRPLRHSPDLTINHDDYEPGL